VKYTQGGTAIAELGLAVNRQWFDKTTSQKKEEVTFVDITLWGRTAEVAGEYLAKGKQILIEGYLKLDQWDDKETGQKRSKLKVIGESMTMLGSGGGGGGGGSEGGEGGGQNGNRETRQESSGYGESTSGGDEVPF